MPRVKSDNKDLDFAPGANGSLTYRGSVEPEANPIPIDARKVAKTVRSPLVDSENQNRTVALNIANRMMNGRFGYK